jgi:hypothetical protein
VAFKPADAVDTARQILVDHASIERGRLNRIAWALNPKARYRTSPPRSEAEMLDYVEPPAVVLPPGAPPTMKNLARKARTNYLPRVLNEFVQALKVDGYRASGGTDNAAPWTYAWQANKMDARQGGIYKATLAYGLAYGTAVPGTDPITGKPAPVVRGVSPRKMTAVYADPVDDDWPLYALKHADPLMCLYDEDMSYFIGREGQSTSVQDFTFIEARPHGMGVPPVVRYRDEMLLDEADQIGIIEPLLSIQARLDETVFGMLVAQFYAAFKQRVVIGWVPKDEEEQLRASASQLWTFKDGPDQVRIAEFSETSPNGYIASKESAVTDMATIGQVPPQSLGNGAVSNLSAEALAAMEASKYRRADVFATSIGESHEQLLRLSAQIMGDTASAEDVSAQVRWADKEARSFAQLVDGLGKVVTMLQVPSRATWPIVASALGMSDTDVAAWETWAKESDAIGSLMSLLDEQATAGKAPSAAEVTEIVATSSADRGPSVV